MAAMLHDGDAKSCAMLVELMAQYGAAVPLQLRVQLVGLFLEHRMLNQAVEVMQAVLEDANSGESAVG